MEHVPAWIVLRWKRERHSVQEQRCHRDIVGTEPDQSSKHPPGPFAPPPVIVHKYIEREEGQAGSPQSNGEQHVDHWRVLKEVID